MPDADISEVAQAHREWEEVHLRLREHEQRLSEAIALYARRRGGRPVELMSEVEALRAECAQKFQALMAALRRTPAD